VKVLFDHNLPHKLRTILNTRCEHEIVTTAFMGWINLKNGELLRAAEDSGFAIFVTGDKSMAHEQNLTGRRLAIVSLTTNNWPIIQDHIPQILASIDRATVGSFQSVDCGIFRRKPSITDNQQ
jgi:predicted nuclease of predicted toxin-antitoxin system